jgi:hypothetical protein
MNDLKTMTLALDNKLKIETSQHEGLLKEIEVAYDPQFYASLSFTSALIYTVKEHFKMRSILIRLKSELKISGLDKIHIQEIIKTAKTKIISSRRIGLLRTMRNIFRYWHIFHLPFAIVMFVIMLIHVAVTIVFGYKWIF